MSSCFSKYIYIYIYKYIYFIFCIDNNIAQLAGAVEYTDCTSAEG